MIDHLAGIIFVDDECGERLALNVFRDDDERLAGLHEDERGERLALDVLGDEASFTAVCADQTRGSVPSPIRAFLTDDPG